MLIRIHSLGFKLGEAVLAPDELKATVFADDCASEAIRQVRVSKSSSGMFCLTACNMATWKEMKRDELCRQYSPSQWSHRMSADEVIKAHEASLREGTERARSITQTLLNVPYGEGQREKLDVYVPTNPSLEMPLVMYLHGGYWEALSKEESGFMAVPLVQKGVAVVAVDYDIAPGGNMDLMVSQVRQSVVSVVQQYAHISGVYLCGHSAGAHLAAMILSTDWSQYAVTPQIKGALLVSGIYNLLPILSTYVNEPLKMTEYVTM
nr:kynurenine formamidase isoform X1 [Paramormyrops kingsleyae]